MCVGGSSLRHVLHEGGATEYSGRSTSLTPLLLRYCLSSRFRSLFLCPGLLDRQKTAADHRGRVASEYRYAF